MDNAGLAQIGVLSFLIATIGGPFKWAFGTYARWAEQRLNTAGTAPRAHELSIGEPPGICVA